MKKIKAKKVKCNDIIKINKSYYYIIHVKYTSQTEIEFYVIPCDKSGYGLSLKKDTLYFETNEKVKLFHR